MDLDSILGLGIGSITVEKAIEAIAIFVICLIVLRLILVIFDRSIDRTKAEKSLHSFMRSGLKIILLFIAILIVADSLGIKITSLIALLSVIGLAVSLAIQGVLSNIASGMMILMSKPFVVGDYIDAGSVGGTVNDIRLVYTTITTPDNKVIFIPNSDISSSRIINYTTQTRRRVDLAYRAAYDCAIDDVKYAIKQVIHNEKRILDEPEPFIGVEEFGDNGIVYAVRIWCKTEDYWPLYYKLQEEIKDSFDQNNVHMTYNHLNVHVKKDEE